MNRFPRRARQNSRPRPLIVFVIPTPDGRSRIFAFIVIKFIRQLSAEFNYRVNSMAHNLKVVGSNPTPATTSILWKWLLTKVLHLWSSGSHYSIGTKLFSLDPRSISTPTFCSLCIGYGLQNMERGLNVWRDVAPHQWDLVNVWKLRVCDCCGRGRKGITFPPRSRIEYKREVRQIGSRNFSISERSIGYLVTIWRTNAESVSPASTLTFSPSFQPVSFAS